MKRNRLLVYVFYDRDGIIDDYALFQLEQMKTQAEKIVMVCQGGIKEEEDHKVASLVDELYTRENKGYDAGAWKECLLDRLGWDEIGKYDDLILMNDSCYGPIYPIADLFGEMDSRQLDFWGITQYFKTFNAYGLNPYGYFPDHIQSYFLCFSNKVHTSNAFRSFWEDLEDTDSFEKSVSFFETVLTKYLEDSGFSWGVFADTSHDRRDSLKNVNPTILSIDELLINQKNPFLKKKHMLSLIDQYLALTDGNLAKRCLDYIDRETDYDADMIYKSIIRLGFTRELYELYHLDHILPEEVVTGERTDKKIALVMHLFYEEQFDFCLHYAKSMPETADIYITVSDPDKAEKIKGVFGEIKCHKLEVRLVDEKGMDISALLIGARDVFLEDYDYVCFIHDKMSFSKTNDRRAGEGFRDCMFHCMLESGAYVENIVNTFERDPYLGLLVPPFPMAGTYTKNFGRVWISNFDGAVEIAEKLQLNCRMDKTHDPLALGTTFWCKPAALRKLFAYPWSYDDFADNSERREGDFMHCVERIFEYVAQDAGYYTGVVMPTNYAQLAYSVTNHMLYRYMRRDRVLTKSKQKLEKKNKKLKSKIENMKRSKSWRYTKWLRRK